MLPSQWNQTTLETVFDAIKVRMSPQLKKAFLLVSTATYFNFRYFSKNKEEASISEDN